MNGTTRETTRKYDVHGDFTETETAALSSVELEDMGVEKGGTKVVVKEYAATSALAGEAAQQEYERRRAALGRPLPGRSTIVSLPLDVVLDIGKILSTDDAPDLALGPNRCAEIAGILTMALAGHETEAKA